MAYVVGWGGGGGLEDTITKDPLKRMLLWGGGGQHQPRVLCKRVLNIEDTKDKDGVIVFLFFLLLLILFLFLLSLWQL